MTKARTSSAPMGQGITQTLGAASAAFGAVAGVAGTAQSIGSAISNAGEGGIASVVRSASLPAAGEAIGDVVEAVSAFGGNEASENDWRVRLSLPKWVSFGNSPVLKPLKDAGGLIFPYTPQVTIKSSAKYTSEPVIHSNYVFNAFKTSDPGTIEITAPMNVEDSEQALYWIAAVHYLRSISKMFSGNDPKAGNPPPIVFLNGYGQFVLKNIPVAIQSFSCQLPQDCDYIATDVVGSAAGAIAGVADSVGNLSDTLGGSFGGAFDGALGSVAGVVSEAAGFIGQAASLAGSFGIGGSTSAGFAYVPTKSSFSITLVPMYSRNSTRQFSLDRFVQGGYINGAFGYI